MKKLMIAAAAVAMVGAVSAGEVANVGYVYDVAMNITTTQAELCEGTQYGECEFEEGDNTYLRISDKFTIRGLVFGCANDCQHLYKFLTNPPKGYALTGKGANGVILWDTEHEVPVLPVKEDGGKDAYKSLKKTDIAWNLNSIPLINAEFVNVIGRSYDRSEIAFAFKGDAAFSNAVYAVQQFNMAGAGWGVFDRVENTKDGKLVDTTGIWTRMGGYVAGTMTAPYVFNGNGVVTDPTKYYALGRSCKLATCTGTKFGEGADESKNTFAVGEWTITYNEAESRAFGKDASVMVDEEWIPKWFPL